MSTSGLRGVIFGLLSGTFGCAPRNGVVALFVRRGRRGITVNIRSRNVKVSRDGGTSLFIHFRGLLSGGLFGRRDSNVNLSLIGRLIRLRGTAVHISDGRKRNDYFAIRFLGNGRRCARGMRFVLSSSIRVEPRRIRRSIRKRRRGEGRDGAVLLIRSGLRLHFFLHDVFVSGFGIVRTIGKTRNLSGTLGFIPSVVVDSVVVPRGSNVAVARSLHTGVTADRVPIILLATGASVSDGLRNVRLKIRSCVAGPFDTACLGTEIRGVLARHIGLRRLCYTGLVGVRPITRRRRRARPRVSSRSHGFVRGLARLVRGGVSGNSLVISSLMRRLTIDHSIFFGGLGALAKLTPVRFVGRVHIGHTTRLVRDNSCGVARVTCVINVGSPHCFDGYFGRHFNVAPARCGRGTGGGQWLLLLLIHFYVIYFFSFLGNVFGYEIFLLLYR